jgi:two-component system chemotaxis response regulator CheY
MRSERADCFDEVHWAMPEKRVLVVDDDAATALLCSRLLQKAGYTPITARDAGQAVTQAHRDQPALIITDLMMPAGGGLSVLERLAMSSKTSAIPILVLTGSADTELERRARAAGALRVLKKPVEPTGLLDAVREVIGEPT